MLNWFISRINEKSTWLGLLSIAGAAGIVIKPELAEAIGTLGLSLGGLLAVIFNENKPQ